MKMAASPVAPAAVVPAARRAPASAVRTEQAGVALVHVAPHPMFFAFLRGQVGFMKTRGFAVHAVTSPGPLLDDLAESEQIPVHAVPIDRRIAPLRDLISVVRLYRELRALRPAIVHSHTPKGGVVGMTAAWLARVPVRVAHSDGLPLLTARGSTRLLLWCSEKVTGLLAHRVLYVSHSNRQIAVAQRLCSSGKAGVLLGGSVNGIDATGRFNPANVRDDHRAIRRAHDIPEDALVVGFVGRLLREKGIAELASAWRVLRREFPGLHLLVSGTFDARDPVSPEVEALLREDPRIHLAGHVTDMPPLYAALDLVALPTYREGFGMVLIEAAAMALPTVATRIPGCVDAVEDGVTGTLVPARDVDALADALRCYLRDPALRSRHGAAGRERVLRDFRQDTLWEMQYHEYIRLLSAKGLSHPQAGDTETA